MKQYTFEKNEGVKYISIPAIDSLNLVYHGFSTKVGGVSIGPFKGMNLSLTAGEDNDLVEINRCMFAKALNAGNPEVYTVRQMHGTRVIRIENNEFPSEEYRQAEADAVVTNQKGLAIGVLTADCVPILVVDKEKQAVAAVHAGREGTMSRVLTHTIRRMKKDFGTLPSNLHVAVGPCIETLCYEVGKDIAQKVRRTNRYKQKVMTQQNGSYYLDLRRMNHLELLDCGVREEHIYHVSMCTVCNSRTFYSHRKQKGKVTGRMMALVMLKE